MQNFRHLYIRKKYRWIIFPLVLSILLLAYTGKYFTFGKEKEQDALSRIKSTGQLIALTDTKSLDYFIYSGEPMGYQYELLRSFADYLGVHLKIISSEDISKLVEYLQDKEGDLIAVNLPSENYLKDEFLYSDNMSGSGYVLIQKRRGSKNSEFISSPDQLNGDTIFMQDNPFLLPVITEDLEKWGAKAIIKIREGVNSEGLIDLVAKGKIKYSVCNENLASVVNDSYSNLDVSVAITKNIPSGWVVRSSSDSLMMKINEWYSYMKKSGRFEKFHEQYFQNKRIAGFFNRDYFSVTDEKLSPYDEQIRNYSRMILWDWRLVASLVYEESNFRTGLVSSRNASGLMQLMPETASMLGVDSTATPSQQILAGVKYLKWLDSQLPVEITDKHERINFILASYNVGIGRVLEARKLAEKNGKDPNKWDGNVDYYLTEKSRRNPNPGDSNDKSPYGMTGGFVAKIIERYHHYRNNIPE